MARLGNYIRQVRGVSYKPGDLFDGPSPDAITVLRANNITDSGEITLDDVVWVAKERVKEQQLIKAGDILVCASSGSKNLVGKAAQAEKDLDVAFGAFCKVVRPMNANKKYIGYFFQSPIYRRSISYASAGVNINNIRSEDLDALAIDLPDADEQAMRVKKLEKLARSIALRKKQLDKIDLLIKSQFIEMFGDPQLNEKAWEVVPLSEIAEYYNGLTYRPEDVADSGVVVLRSSNIQNSELDFSDIVRVSCDVKSKLFVKDGDILMCSRNGSAKLVGKVAPIKGLREDMTFGAFMMIIRSQYPEYLLTYFKMSAFREQIKVGATTTINQITSNMLNKIRLPLPTKAALDKFAAFVEQTDKSKIPFEMEVAA